MENIVGKRIEDLLQKLDMSQRELAQKAGVTEVTISRYINNSRNPRSDIIAKIASVLGTTTDYILGTDTPSTTLKGKDIPNELSGFTAIDIIGTKEDLTQDEIEELKRFADYIKSKRKKD